MKHTPGPWICDQQSKRGIMPKQKYKGIFNFNGELIPLWTHATNKKSAKAQFIIQLEKKLNRTSGSLRRYFSGGMANYEIKVINE